MTFANFELSEPFGCVILRAFGHEWDLHSFAVLVAVQQPNDASVASLEWQVPPDIDNAWGSPGNTAKGCRLVFSGVRRFDIKAGEPTLSADSQTVAGISKTIPGESDYPFKQHWTSDELFCLRVELEDLGQIEIDAEVAALEPISRFDV
jgi:hypothetical protein